MMGKFSKSLANADVKAPVLIHIHQTDFQDGYVNTIVPHHLLESLKHVKIAEFQRDHFTDVTFKRPLLVMENWTYKEEILPSTMRLFLVYDDAGKPFLLLFGSEPQRHWDDYVKEILELIKPYGVRKAITCVPLSSNIPHTRRVKGDICSPNPELVSEKHADNMTLRVFMNIDTELQKSFNYNDIDAYTCLMPVPFYLAGMDYPQGGYELLNMISELTDLVLPMGELAVATEKMNKMLATDESVTNNMDTIAALERNYDENSNYLSTGEQANQVGEFPTPNEDFVQTIENFLQSQNQEPEQTYAPQTSFEKDEQDYGVTGFIKRLFKKN